MKDGGVQVVHVTFAANRVEAEFIRFTHHIARFHAAAGKPHAEGIDMVIASRCFTCLAHGRASKFTAPNYESII